MPAGPLTLTRLRSRVPQALEPYPALRNIANEVYDGHHMALGVQMQVLDQMLHRKIFTPIRKEVEGRKEIEKRINDRKKVEDDPPHVRCHARFSSAQHRCVPQHRRCA